MEGYSRRSRRERVTGLPSAARRPCISVVVIFHNAGSFLEDAILSVCEQSYEHWELLLVDDGSTDASPAIARRYAAQQPARVRYLEHEGHENRGMSASRNLGISASTGEYVALLDADDVWFPNALQDQVDLLEQQPAAAAVCGVLQCWHSWTGEARDARRDFVIGPRWRDRVVHPPDLLLHFLEDSRETPSALMIRREVFSAIGGFEEAFRGLYEDQVFCAKLCLHAPVYVSSTCWYRYRHHPTSSCSRATVPESACARSKFLEWLESYLQKTGRVTDALSAAIAVERAAVQPVDKRVKTGPGVVRRVARALPTPVRTWIRDRLGRGAPPVGRVRLGALRRTRPVSREWGYDRGRPIDRYYIEGFLAAHAADIRGDVLELLNGRYTMQFGGDRVTRSEVLSLTSAPEVTLVGDLATGVGIPSGAFDCIILTQTLQFIYDIKAVVRTVYRTLKPGGVLLATVPGISQISRLDMEQSGDYWRFTSASAQRLFSEAFPRRYVSVQGHGNVLAATAFLHGLATEELHEHELRAEDRDYELVVTVRAVKPNVSASPTSEGSAVDGAHKPTGSLNGS
jgi:GT2 family glycosyltransferase/SAM-dependent methyltransferase